MLYTYLGPLTAILITIDYVYFVTPRKTGNWRNLVKGSGEDPTMSRAPIERLLKLI